MIPRQPCDASCPHVRTALLKHGDHAFRCGLPLYLWGKVVKPFDWWGKCHTNVGEVPSECIRGTLKKIFSHIIFFSVSAGAPSEFFLLDVQRECQGKKSHLTVIATWRGETRETHLTDILGTPSMGKAMVPGRRWTIGRIERGTNGGGPTCEQTSYMTLRSRGSPTPMRGGNQKWLLKPCRLPVGGHMWAKWLHNPYHLGDQGPHWTQYCLLPILLCLSSI